jgi:hypothetical protein
MLARLVGALSARDKGVIRRAGLKSPRYDGGGLYFLTARRLVVVEGVCSRTK